MAGRVLSKTNETKLRNALAALNEVLGLLDGEDQAQQEAMREAANLGHWLESRLHLTFTQLADELFGEGRLTRDERIVLSSAIGAALSAYNAEIQNLAPHIYQRRPWEDAPEPDATVEATEAAVAEYTQLVEGAVRRDGSALLKIIQPGWGSSGYYPSEVLERDGPAVFRAGTKMYWNHPTPAEEADRPEGDLRDLAAELVQDARWDAAGPAGPGLYAAAKVFGNFQNAVNELAPHIGVSIRAAGRAVSGEMDGRKGPIIQQIVAAKSVDFVTEPGAGGRIVNMFEAARRPGAASSDNGALSNQEDTVSAEIQSQLTEAQRQIDELRTQNARLQEALLLREAREFVAQELAAVDLPGVTSQRLAGQLAARAPIVDGQMDAAAYRQLIAEAVRAEQEYLAAAAGYGHGRIAGMGAAEKAAADDSAARMTDAFARLGLSESGVKAAVNGR